MVASHRPTRSFLLAGLAVALWAAAGCSPAPTVAGGDGGPQGTSGSGSTSGGGTTTGGAAVSGLDLLAGQPNGPGSADGTGAAASFNRPAGIASDGAGKLFVADTFNATIRELTVATGAVTTLAGTAGAVGSADGTGATARFNFPEGLAYDGAGHLFVADADNDTIREVTVATGAVTTLAGRARSWGNGDGTGAAARFNGPRGLAYDGAGHLFIADSDNDTIRELTVATGAVSTLAGNPTAVGSADGTGAAATFNRPFGLAYDGAGNLFVSDTGNNTIRELTVATGAVTTLAGTAGVYGGADGIGGNASFSSPEGLATDGAGNLFVADQSNATIRELTVATGAVSTLAGTTDGFGSANGAGAKARFNYPAGLATDGAGHLFVADYANNAIRELTVATAAVTTLAGTAPAAGSADGTGTAARFDYPDALSYDGAGHLFVLDSGNETIREVAVATRLVTTLAGEAGTFGSADGTGAAARFSTPLGLANDGAGHLFVADSINGTIREVTVATGAVTTLAGRAGAYGAVDGTGAAARFNVPEGLAYDGAGHLFVADYSVIREVVVATGVVTTLAGAAGVTGSADGTGAAARFNFPNGLAYDGADHLFVVDTTNETIRVVTVSTGIVTTLAGTAGVMGSADGTGAAARFRYPAGLAYDGAGHLFVADESNSTIRLVTIATGEVTTPYGLAGRAGVVLGAYPAGLDRPAGLALGTDGATLFISDSAEDVILVAR